MKISVEQIEKYRSKEFYEWIEDAQMRYKFDFWDEKEYVNAIIAVVLMRIHIDGK